jgi:hypothetical protein
MSSTQPLEHVSFDKPDEVREGTNWRLELVNLAGGRRLAGSPCSRAGSGLRTSSPWPVPTCAWRRTSSIR